MKRAFIPALLAGSLLLASCEDDVDTDLVAPVFTAEMTGAYSAPLSGRALFGVTIDNNANANGMALLLGDSAVARIVFVSTNTPKPPARTYEIVAPGSPVGSDTVWTGNLFYVINGTVEKFAMSGGTISLTNSTHSSVTGNFEFSAVRTSPCCDPAPVEISVTGTFNAAQIPQEF